MWYKKRVLMPEAKKALNIEHYWESISPVLHMHDVPGVMDYLGVRTNLWDAFFDGPFSSAEEARAGKK